MFCLIYFSNQPNVLEISQSKEYLQTRMEEKAIQQSLDEVGRNNFVNTLDMKDALDKIQFKIYPSLGLIRSTPEQIQVHKIVKKQVVVKGYLYNTTEDTVETKLIGTYYVLPVENWKYEELPSRPTEEVLKSKKPIPSSNCPQMIKNYDKVLLELITSIQKRKID
jgi:hypothetical protein